MQVLSRCEFTVERGPDCLFIRPQGSSMDGHELDLAEQVWSLLEQSMTYRVVLELDDIDLLTSGIVGQLILLHRKVCEQGGLMRLCGMSARNQRVLEACCLDEYLPQYANRTQAVMGERRVKPR